MLLSMKGLVSMKTFLAFLFLLFVSVASAETQYLGLYLQGNKLGYSAYTSGDGDLNGRKLKRSDTKTVMDTGLLGTAVTIEMSSTTWSTAEGRPVRMSFLMTSGGRDQKVEANFGEKEIQVQIENNGQKSVKTLPIPGDASVIDDPLTQVTAGTLTAGLASTFYVLDPTTVSLLKNEVKVLGPSKVTVDGKEFDTTGVEIIDPRSTMTVYLSAKGDLVKARGPMGIEMIPVSKAVALAPPGKYAPGIDLAYATALRTDKPITEPDKLRSLKLRVTAKNVRSVPSDDHQTAKQEGEGWVIEVHPPQVRQGASATIANAAKQKPEWTNPSLYIPSDSPQFVEEARRIIGQKNDVRGASLAIHRHVNAIMKPNAGIGVLRDASEVMKTKEGVCRDYAILTVTLLRAAGIPTRLASGLVNWDGIFYYHAWAEVWDGTRWFGVDTTAEREQVSAAHVKLGGGNVEEAFTFTFLDGAKIEVLGSTRN
jgi:hypothetical protein